MIDEEYYSEEQLIEEIEFWQDVCTEEMYSKYIEARESEEYKPKENQYKNILLDFLKSKKNIMRLFYADSKDARNPYRAFRTARSNNMYMFEYITISKNKECITLRKKPKLYA